MSEVDETYMYWPDRFTRWSVAVTFDGSRSAQFEHTILITETGYELLTGKSKNCIRQFWESED
ncbi:hypothetical protein T484DRAFT_1761800 [Baffinella frigidus]|nr:hypothetical protein T484DRAFT_1761800 [Cryptophyta sp. CCMP2293]